jgi:hypothetical protein
VLASIPDALIELIGSRKICAFAVVGRESHAHSVEFKRHLFNSLWQVF